MITVVECRTHVDPIRCNMGGLAASFVGIRNFSCKILSDEVLPLGQKFDHVDNYISYFGIFPIQSYIDGNGGKITYECTLDSAVINKTGEKHESKIEPEADIWEAWDEFCNKT